MAVSSAPTLLEGLPLLEGLTASQRRAVESPSATVCVLAAAGAGKTRVLTRRIAFRVQTGSAKAGHVVAITFTKKAALELRERLARLGLDNPPNVGGGLFAGTFHSFAWRQLRRWWADRRTPEPAVLQTKARLVGELASGRAGLSDVAVADLAGCIEWAKARLLTPAAFATAARAANRELPADPEAIGALYARYEDEKRRRRLVDFDDLLARYTEALGADSQFGAAQRWKWAHVFVDELQDVNPLQCRLLTALLGGHDDLFVVGDPNQAIYGWNGADPAFLTSFPSRFPDAEVVRLDDNHRSSPQIVAAATAVLGRQSSGHVRSTRPDGPLPALRCFASDRAEAAGIAAEALEARARGQSWRQMAVLARTNAQLAVVAEALSAASVPFSAPGSEPAAELPLGNEGDDETSPARVAEASERDPDGTLTLCTFHRAKGLQWPAVWVAGLEAGLVPVTYATSPASLAEERRLLYVALTRAETSLQCSWARERRAGNGAALRRAPSPWLAALAPHCSGTGQGDGDDMFARELAGPGRDGRLGGAPFLAMARYRLAKAPVVPGGRNRLRGAVPQVGLGTTGADSIAVAEQLREWRRRHARASGVPPHVLLHDSTLLALARTLPSNNEDLLAVPGLGPVKVARFGQAILDVVTSATGGRAAAARDR